MTDKVRHVAILAHPDPGSFNAAIARTYIETVQACGQAVVLRDLYGLGFDPVLKNCERPDRRDFSVSADVREELAIIDGADMYTVIHPIWFAMPPAMLVGYVDRVLGSGVTAAQVQAGEAQGVLRAKHLLVVTTSGASQEWLGDQGQMEALKTVMTRYLFKAFGAQRADYLHFGGVVDGYPRDQADLCLRDVADRTRRLCRLLAEERGG